MPINLLISFSGINHLISLGNEEETFWYCERVFNNDTRDSDWKNISQINKAFCLVQKPILKNLAFISQPLDLVFLPYIKGTTDQISKILAKKNIKTIFNPTKPLNNFLELLRINLIQCSAQEFTKFPVPM